MKKLSNAEQDHYLQILEKQKGKLLSYEGVKDVAIGYPKKNGKQDTDKIAILVFVVKKASEETLLKEQVLPKSLEGLRVDVIESHPYKSSYVNKIQNSEDVKGFSYFNL